MTGVIGDDTKDRPEAFTPDTIRRMKKHVVQAAHNIDTPLASANPTMKRRVHEAMVRQNVPGAADFFQKGECGELGLKCSVLYTFGLKGCSGGVMTGPDGKPVVREPCPYGKRGHLWAGPTGLAHTKGKVLQDYSDY